MKLPSDEITRASSMSNLGSCDGSCRKPSFGPLRDLVNLDCAHLDVNGLSNITPADYAIRESLLAAPVRIPG